MGFGDGKIMLFSMYRGTHKTTDLTCYKMMFLRVVLESMVCLPVSLLKSTYLPTCKKKDFTFRVRSPYSRGKKIRRFASHVYFINFVAKRLCNIRLSALPTNQLLRGYL